MYSIVCKSQQRLKDQQQQVPGEGAMMEAICPSTNGGRKARCGLRKGELTFVSQKGCCPRKTPEPSGGESQKASGLGRVIRGRMEFACANAPRVL